MINQTREQKRAMFTTYHSAENTIGRISFMERQLVIDSFERPLTVTIDEKQYQESQTR